LLAPLKCGLEIGDWRLIESPISKSLSDIWMESLLQKKGDCNKRGAMHLQSALHLIEVQRTLQVHRTAAAFTFCLIGLYDLKSKPVSFITGRFLK